jgi:hypothetical protein
MEVGVMRSVRAKTPTQERERRVTSGWVMLPITIAPYVAGGVFTVLSFIGGTTTSSNAAQPDWWLLAAGVLAILAAALLSPGFFALQPNEARVLVLFGDYRGTATSRVSPSPRSSSAWTHRLAAPEVLPFGLVLAFGFAVCALAALAGGPPVAAGADGASSATFRRPSLIASMKRA